MTQRAKKSGLTLTELIVTMSIVAVIAGIGLPAANQLQKSFESSSRLHDVVAAALSNARASALARGIYTGIRFQQDARGDQYMIFIEQDNNVKPGIVGNRGFRAMQGRNPIRLPKRGTMMDMRLKADYSVVDPYTTEISLLPLYSPVALTDAARDNYLQQQEVLLDLQTFSIIFTPAGKLIQATLKVSFASPPGKPDIGRDIFDEITGDAMFTHDDDAEHDGLQIESSRNHFVIVDKMEFNEVLPAKRWSSYLQYLKQFYINPYTGEIIN